jgi:hypothetical protein
LEAQALFQDPPGSGRLTLAVKLKGSADALELRLYSKAMTCVFSARAEGAFQAGWNHAGFEVAGGLPNGLYYSQATAKRVSGQSASGGTGKVYWLR